MIPTVSRDSWIIQHRDMDFAPTSCLFKWSSDATPDRLNDLSIRACIGPQSKRGHVARLASSYWFLAVEATWKKFSNLLTQLDVTSNYQEWNSERWLEDWRNKDCVETRGNKLITSHIILTQELKELTYSSAVQCRQCPGLISLPIYWR